MSDTPTATLNDTDRSRLFGTWLKPIKPAKGHSETLVEKLAPWRHQFTEAIAAGYTWNQLATEVATKPEIGIEISATYLKKCIYAAYKAAGETMPGQRKTTRRHRRSQAKTLVTTAATPATAAK